MIKPAKLKLADIPTPIQEVEFDGKKFFMKRDDFTGIELSGNKARKLEYLLYEAQSINADYIFTCGGKQSNHVRATALAAISKGMKTKAFLPGKKHRTGDGNQFFLQLINTETMMLTMEEYAGVNKLMSAEKEKFEKEGKKVYIIPEGGSSELGIWGYVNFVDEISNQIDTSWFDGIVLAAGTDGTAAGILIGLATNNINWKVHIVNVLYNPSILQDKIEKMINGFAGRFGLDAGNIINRLEFHNGYSSLGYNRMSFENVSLVKRFAQSSGIILDPVYTGKAFKCYNDEFLVPGKSEKNLFLHTGGIFGAMIKSSNYFAV
ncbi:MAG: pyridoxal-phosphate dependent enzyme [Melioribacteraceae bacterium]|nr:pyridoxal-phosphate dependent enzyme [Melioribacteraceae bacterium]MCF8355113.1 pyridoxal-phosphate dependent enzyme [Melioribacteraceae bacterium]MCF8392410.1 pyridoxal-phosphate dependent enzyme [Melioribacteraceae bacterium]MCF8417931.1 pyridoxal-phosphate dependent enzyme [Melioribacteraceae bacterium]